MMSQGDWYFWLLADQSPLDQMSESFRGDKSPFGLVGFLLVLAALAAIGWVSSWLGRHGVRGTGRGIRSPRLLFRELCNAHQLDRDSRRLLMRLARHCRLSQPAGVFIDPRCFDPDNWSIALSCHSAELLSLRERLFGNVGPLE